jgi:peroxiredoxin/uncharacterized membrane protein YphA (DoxX/SURF4 family)
MVIDLLLFVARFALALVFTVASLAKLRDLRGARQGLVDFGVPLAVARPVAVLLPVGELATAVALVVPATVWLGGVAGAVLLAAFTAAIAANLWRGRRPDCRCFGQIAAGPIGASSIARNLLLMALAMSVVVQGPSRGWPGPFEATSALATPPVMAGLIAALTVVALLEGWLFLQVLQQNGRLLLRVEAIEAKLAGSPAAPAAAESAVAGLPVGSRAPGFQLAGLHGETLTLDALRASGKPVLLVFTDPDCGPCTALLPDLARWQRQLAGTLTVAFISRGSRDANRTKATEHGLANMLMQQKDEVADAFRARGTPAAVLVSAEGTIASPVFAGAEAIRGLVARFSGQAQSVSAPAPVHAANGDERCPHCGQVHATTPPASRIRVGEAAPDITLPDLTGRTVFLADFEGEETLVLFWNPSCGFCQQMTEEWRNWEATRPADAPRPLIISTGTVDANRAMNLSSPVLMEPQFSAGYAFGASGTPSAVLIDREGRIASAVAVGAAAVMQLARGKRSTRPA